MEDIYLDNLFYGIDDSENDDIMADYDLDPIEA